MDLKVCTNCKTEKNENDFYKQTITGKYKRTCKHCENQRRCKYEEYNCKYCEITINKRCKIKHDKSHRHMMNYFWGG